jgi:hypothetical protein
VGSFYDWTPGAHEMHEDGQGGRSGLIEVPFGDEVHFRYLAEGGQWFGAQWPTSVASNEYRSAR